MEYLPLPLFVALWLAVRRCRGLYWRRYHSAVRQWAARKLADGAIWWEWVTDLHADRAEVRIQQLIRIQEYDREGIPNEGLSVRDARRLKRRERRRQKARNAARRETFIWSYCWESDAPDLWLNRITWETRHLLRTFVDEYHRRWEMAGNVRASGRRA
jgi:hypothetical protein